jgi:hypothetical protein
MAQLYSAGLRAGRSGVSASAEDGEFSLGSTQRPIQWVPGGLSLGVKGPWCEADRSPPSVQRSVREAIPPLPDTL